MRSRTILVAVLAGLALAGAACGSSKDKSAGGVRTVDIEMRDTAFSPTAMTVTAGKETKGTELAREHSPSMVH